MTQWVYIMPSGVCDLAPINIILKVDITGISGVRAQRHEALFDIVVGIFWHQEFKDTVFVVATLLNIGQGQRRKVTMGIQFRRFRTIESQELTVSSHSENECLLRLSI